jgi:nucleotidyltransferase/DNA polymerase involved in DNA repair
MGEGPILHADLDAFYASVEQRDVPRPRGRPVIVGAGVVLAASYEAKAHGVRTTMAGGQARRLCPQAVVVPPRTWGRRPRSSDELDAILAGLIDRVARRLRAARRTRRTVTLRMRFTDFTRATRSHTLVQATAHTQTILTTARGLLIAAKPMIQTP